MTQAVKYLKDYQPFGFNLRRVHLSFTLAPQSTRVRSRLEFTPKPGAPELLELDGEDLTLIQASIDGTPVTPELHAQGLRVAVPNRPFTFEAEVEIAPADNTALEGLYMSRGMFCTQCEAEGFRRITFFPDRPDVMAPYTVRIESALPVLLSNGNPTASGPGWAEWHDPHPKPSYLFALVAGDLIAQSDSFTTASGRDVALNLWVRPGDEDKCDWAMLSLKRAMAWDEKVYEREYDLDLFNIVAVDDFNAGAMENKGLNIFNSALVLANPQITTDASYERIESVIAHEYFHNWTGNRITCRDWFQLSLKEGLTVFRDRQFTSDLRSEPVKRISDVSHLRAGQFTEDAGPLAHPVRPESYVEIDNFYTSTVYVKGSEVIRMLRILVGDQTYERALQLYFERHDGQACTIEDWLAVFQEVSGRDLSQFKLWYNQAGTPVVTVSDHWENGRYQLHFRQSIPDTPGQSDKKPMVIPIQLGLLDETGTELRPTQLIELTDTEQTVSFDLPQRPVPSLLRGFSAPVKLDTTALPDHRALLLAHDTDPFNRWEAGRALAKGLLLDQMIDSADFDSLSAALAPVLADESLDPAFRAALLALPGEGDLVQSLAERGVTPDPITVRQTRDALRRHLAAALEPVLSQLFEAHQVPGDFDPSAQPAGKRALTNRALALLTLSDDGARAKDQFKTANNMTQSLGALSALLSIAKGADEADAFATRWQEERLAMNLWFSARMDAATPDDAPEILRALTAHRLFDEGNPNRVYAAFGPFLSTPSLLHGADGAGYTLLGDWVLRMDPRNPSVAARLSSALQTWRLFDADRQALIGAQLERISNAQLSPDTREMIDRIRG